MSNRPLSRALLLAILMPQLGAVAAPEPGEDLPSIEIHGTVYINACTPSKLIELRQSLLALHPPKPNEIWKAVEIILCGDGDRGDRAKIRPLFPKKLRTHFEATASEPLTRYELLSNDLVDRVFARRRAWGAQLNEKGNKIELSYAPDEACQSGLTFIFSKAKWRVLELGGACD